ncbi:uncharacterized protein PgNI_02238 [Pyricularia grisea]|uniref:Uncharacterized protein n=1 Tax=Pyricularia grisea TaxID=148305 RepID=A0A6P8BKY2_PYRGI|nr:uncharacterized protein PgNI_02238 [Pyricularia grisea]TLD17325.1 hypothetical protein PgNI_02238 [Pyricularia grisea]
MAWSQHIVISMTANGTTIIDVGCGPLPSSVEFKYADILDWNSYLAHLPLAARNMMDKLTRQADVFMLKMLLSEVCWEYQLRKVLASAAKLVKPCGRVVGYTLAMADGKSGVFGPPWERYSRFSHDRLSLGPRALT